LLKTFPFFFAFRLTKKTIEKNGSGYPFFPIVKKNKRFK